jgi:putative hemolysin
VSHGSIGTTGVRPDVKVIANQMLRRVNAARGDLVFVDVFRRRRAMTNAAAVRSAMKWLKNGGALIVFPAGEVSHIGTEDGQLVDRRWSRAVGRLVQHTASDVVPILVAGRNSGLFKIVGRVHPLLRTALLPGEFLRLRGKTVRVRVGSPIPFSRLAELGGCDRIADYLRFRTYALSESTTSERVVSTPSRATICAAEPAAALEAELASLPVSNALVRTGAFEVYIARAEEIPRALREIGRLRELAFRAAGEGTGRECDLDRFDTHYRHLFVWHRERREIAGAYRMGSTDEILPALGIAGLYSRTLFQFDDRLLRQIAPALELGRAFVRPEYQKEYQPLLLLWRAIATFVSRAPRYRMLFGPVSISNDYASLSRQILTRFLMATSYQADLGKLVAPANPPRFLRARGHIEPAAGNVVETLTDVAAILADIEGKSKGIPVLVRQYLKLNAKLLGFNVDPAFGHALDGLMLVDLTRVDRTVLDRYMGRSQADAFLAHHSVPTRRAS